MNLVNVYLPLNFSEYKSEIATYLDEIRQTALEVLKEESILVTARINFHAED